MSEIYELEDDIKKRKRQYDKKSKANVYDQRSINFRKDIVPYAEIEAAAKRAGIPVNRFIGIAVMEKIERDCL